MVQRLARGPFKAEIRVRFPLALPILKKANKNGGNLQLLPALVAQCKKDRGGNRDGSVLYYSQWTRAPWRRQSDSTNVLIPRKATLVLVKYSRNGSPIADTHARRSTCATARKAGDGFAYRQEGTCSKRTISARC